MFVHHYLQYSYSVIQTSLDGEQTLSAKNTFELHAATCGVEITSYRADNWKFAKTSFRDAVQ